MAILVIFSPSLGDLILTNRSGVNFQKENIRAANKIKTGNFQNLFGNYQRSSENIRFSYKSSKENSVYLGFLTPPSRPLIPLSTWRSARTDEVIFLLVMDANLVECTKAQELWREFDMILSQNVQNADLVELLNGCLHIMEDSNMELVRRRAIPWMLWTIWKNRNSLLYLTGGAWITRDHRGEVGMHARDALLPSPDRLSAEMNCLLWVLRSLRDLRFRRVIAFEVESRGSNKVAIEIANSVLRDGRLQSYLALGGPSWLHDLIQTEVTFVNS
ncbi:hypothetical protein DY000_02048424 [Brassica cretica]|uniref:RNase H type-1 domain-containing protein n=1 Tax=Brassica cretica TaxID=69181 RepID=A0ABQ7ET19_BRACR|nr:hypothetical protein DY000_02048424 [Brassica cretica]